MTTSTEPGAPPARLASHRELRALAGAVPAAREMIGFRCHQVAMARWRVVYAGEELRSQWMSDAAKRAAMEAARFFKRPSASSVDFSGWISWAAREVLESDSLAVLPTKGRLGRFLFGGSAGEAEILEGAQICAVIDERCAPRGFHEHERDSPRLDFTTQLREGCGCTCQGDMFVLGCYCGTWRRAWRPGEIIARPWCRRTWTTAGFSPLEAAIVWRDDAGDCDDGEGLSLERIDLEATAARLPAAFGLDVPDGWGREPDLFLTGAGGILPYLASVCSDVLAACGAPDLQFEFALDGTA